MQSLCFLILSASCIPPILNDDLASFVMTEPQSVIVGFYKLWQVTIMGKFFDRSEDLSRYLGVMGCNMRTAQSRVRNALKIMRKEQENER
jgi:hypothetical protein